MKTDWIARAYAPQEPLDQRFRAGQTADDRNGNRLASPIMREESQEKRKELRSFHLAR